MSTLSKLLLWFNIVSYDIHACIQDIAPQLHGRLLDIGCGQKQQVFFQYVREYIGLDHEDALKVNRTTENAQVDVYGDAMDLPFGKNTFDSVCAISLLEHVPDPWKVINEAHRVLKKGGTFALIAPFMYRLHLAPYDYFRFSEYGMRYMLESEGFTIVKLEAVGGMWKMIAGRLAGYLYSDIAGLGYGEGDRSGRQKKWYLLPVILPAIALIVLVGRALDKLHCVKKDAALMYAVCTKK
jgi:ubiquinone/menaquinone biosynthesis C-methylase UbiE